MTKHRYVVTIPYYHRFTVTAENEQEALEVAHSEGNGVITGYDDDQADIEMVGDVYEGVLIERRLHEPID